MRLFETEEALRPVRDRMATMLVPNVRLPDMVFRPTWRHFVLFDGDLIGIDDFYPCMADFLRRRNESEFCVASLEPDPAEPNDFLGNAGLYGALAFDRHEDDHERYQKEIRSELDSCNELHLSVVPDVFFVCSLTSEEWVIVSEWYERAGIAAFRDEAIASDFVNAFCGQLWPLWVVVEERDDVYSRDEIQRFVTNYGSDLYPVPNECLMPDLRE